MLRTSASRSTLLGILAIPVAIGVAMLRYRLYEVDRVISRTLVYGALTVILGAAYVGLVLAGQAVFSSFAGGSDLAIAGSTLVVAALFLPLRSRVQRFVDHRFYRRRYDAQRTLEAFGARLREQVDLVTLADELRGAVEETMQPAAPLALAPERSPVVSRRTAARVAWTLVAVSLLVGLAGSGVAASVEGSSIMDYLTGEGLVIVLVSVSRSSER